MKDRESSPLPGAAGAQGALCEAALAASARRGKLVAFEQVIPYRKGGPRRVRASYIPDLGPEGAACGFFAVASDLKEEVTERDKGLGDHDLTRRAYVSRLSAIGEMSSEIIHEISQPLTAIAGHSDACLRVLARISHQASAATAPWYVLSGFRSVGLLNVVSATPARPSVAKASHSAPLNRLATNPVEKCGPGSAGASADELTPWLRDVDAQARRARDIIHGPGVPEQWRARVFEPFVTSKPEGVGMGLAISCSIIGAHRGQITVADRPGGGVRFRFALPRYVE